MDLCVQDVHLRWLPSAFWVVLFGFFLFSKQLSADGWLREMTNFLPSHFPIYSRQWRGERGEEEKETCQMCFYLVNVKETAKNVDILALRTLL